MYYGAYDEETIKLIKPIGKKPIVIRLLDKKEEPLNYDNVLTLYIDDINDELKGNVFNINHIKQINDFILNNDFDEILVHCCLGISRSPAILCLIALILDDSKMYNDIINFKHFVPNKYILDLSIKYKDKLIIKKLNENMILRNIEYEDIFDNDINEFTLSFKDNSNEIEERNHKRYIKMLNPNRK